MKQSGVEKATRVPKARSQQPPIPSEYEKWVKNRTIDLSEASPYYKKGWKHFQLFVSAHFQDRGTSRYELDEPLFNLFSSRLRQVRSTNALCAVEGANVVAKSLCYAARSFFRQADDGSTFEIPEEGPAWPEPNEAINDGLLPEMGAAPPMSQSWHELGKHPVPTLAAFSLHKPRHTRWEYGYSYDDPTIRVVPKYNRDRSTVPTLTVTIEGAAVGLLMKQKVAGRHDHERASELWERLHKWLSVSIGLLSPTKGRPKRGQGGDAAFLHYHCELPWLQVARRLCGSNHRHDRKCAEIARKQAQRYWRELEHQVLATVHPRQVRK